MFSLSRLPSLLCRPQVCSSIRQLSTTSYSRQFFYGSRLGLGVGALGMLYTLFNVLEKSFIDMEQKIDETIALNSIHARQIIENPSVFSIREIGGTKRSLKDLLRHRPNSHFNVADDLSKIDRIYTERMRPVKDKFRRSVRKAQKLGKGLIELERQGYSGRVMDERYWVESLVDGRYNPKLLVDLFYQWKFSSNDVSFNVWLSSRVGEGSEGYFSVDKRKEYELKVEGGKLVIPPASYKSSRINLNELEYVISWDCKLYGACIGKYSPHHSFFVAGEPVIGAGSIRCNEQFEVEAISNISGHYKPGPVEVLQTLRFFQSQGINLTDVELIVIAWECIFGFVTNIYNASEYLISEGNCRPIKTTYGGY